MRTKDIAKGKVPCCFQLLKRGANGDGDGKGRSYGIITVEDFPDEEVADIKLRRAVVWNNKNRAGWVKDPDGEAISFKNKAGTVLEVYTYNAGKGDCIRLRFAETHNIIIDSGVTRFAPEFKRICDQIIASGETLDILILTHVDDDHIGGILANLRFSAYECPFQEVWMNYDGTTSASDTNLSTRQNNEVAARLIARGVPIIHTVKADKRIVVGATIEVLWPENTEVEPEQRIDVHLAHHNDYGQSLSHLAEDSIKLHDSSQNNKNSIVFTFDFEDHRLLFTGDAWAEDVVRATGYFDLVKLPHHGSARNISEQYPSSFHASDYLICTDGVDHPDKQTIAKLEKWYGNINVYSPSAWWKNGYFVDDDKIHNIKYFQKEGLVIAW